MSMTLTDLGGDYPAETLAEAKRWVDGLADPSGLYGTWRLQVLEQRVKIDPSTGEKTERPVRIVRFAKGCPLALMSAAERYLLSLAPYEGRIANGIAFPGSYRPTRTRWVRDDQLTVDDQRRSTNENRYTLVQDLVDSLSSDGDTVPASEDCLETVVTEYHWDEPALPGAAEVAASHPSGQGVTVSVQQVARQEDGTYRYAIVTRTAKTRFSDPVQVECTAFQTVTQQDFANLYGSPDAGFADGTGAAVVVPSQTCGTGGVNVEWRNLRQNDDCTWNVTVVTTEAGGTEDSERTSSETTVELRDSRRATAQAAGVEHVRANDPNLSGDHGKVFEQRSEKRPDGKFDNTVTERREKELADQVVEKRRTIRGTTVRRVNRNMKAPAPDPAAGTVGTVVNTVTDSGRVTQEITAVDKVADPVDAGEGCAKTVFEHVTTERTVQPEKPAGHVADAANGVRFERTSRITEEGSFDVTVERREELPKARAQVTVRKTLRGTQRTVVDRNVASALPETGLAVGETRQSEVTPGGLYNTTKTVTTAEAAGGIGKSCEMTANVHTDSATANQAAEPSVEVGPVPPNRSVRKAARRTEENTWDFETQTTTFTPATGAGTAGGGLATDEVEVGTNALAVPGGAGGVNREVSLTLSPNDHGSFSYTKHTRTYSPNSGTATSNFATESITTVRTVNATNLSPMSSNGTASVSPNDRGSATTEVTTYVPKPVNSGWITWDSVVEGPRYRHKYHHGVCIFRNLAAPVQPPNGKNGTIQADINRYGLYDGRTVYSDLYAWEEGGGSGGSSVYGGIQEGVVTVWYPKLVEGATGGPPVAEPDFYKVYVRHYYGRGNEGSEARAIANMYMFPGVSLPGRTYAYSFDGYTDYLKAMEANEAIRAKYKASLKALAT